MPNGATITSTHVGLIPPIPELPPAARTGHLFPELTTNALMSIGVLCDHGCEAHFTESEAVITFNDKPVLRGTRQSPGLWTVKLSSSANTAATCVNYALSSHPAYDATSTLADLVQFLHAACYSPAPSTWIRAVQQGHFTTWPMLTAEAIRKHLPQSIPTAKGHMDQKRQNIRSTKRDNAPDDSLTMHKPEPPLQDGQRTNFVYAAVMDVHSPSGQIHGDLTGRFPVQSSRGNKYLLIVYDYDSNAIIAEPMKNRTDSEMLRAYGNIHSLLINRGLRPQLQRMDNEASKALKQHLHQTKIEFQLVPPHIHRQNVAERAIRTFKNHFIAGLCSTDPKFPMHLWCRLIKQAELTLNLLRTSRLNPKLSAYAQLHGQFDFNRTPMAPPGTRVVAHEKPSQRASWAPHGEDGWYIGPALEHYRCYKVYINKTRAERTVDTVEFFPTQVNMPKLSSADAALKAAIDLIAALKHPHPAAPFAPLGDTKMNALEQLADIFSDALPRVGKAKNFERGAPTTKAPVLMEPIASRTRSHPAPAQPSANHVPQLAHRDADDWMQYANAIINPETGKSMEYRDLIRDPTTKAAWLTSSANEFGHLAQGIGGRVQGTDTIFFIPRDKVPQGRKPTYARFVCTYRPQKNEPNRTRLTVGGNLIDYPGDKSTRTSDLTTIKCLLNSTVSTDNAKFMCIDIKNFYLDTPLDRYEYMRIHISLIPQEVIDEYKLQQLKDKHDYVYMEIRKGMYGLPQAGIIANKLLAKRLAKHGYFQTTHTPGLWTHAHRPITFCLVVDDFGVKYVGKDHAQHLLSALKNDYEAVSTDWEGTLYCGITLKWDYKKRTVQLSMPGYIENALHKFQHPPPTRPEDAPYKYNEPQYGAKIQMTDPIDNSDPLPAADVKRLQQVTGTFLYYARAVDSTMLVALSDLAAKQAHGTEATAKAAVKFLNYCATHPDAILQYSASDMILKIHSDASYLSAPKARSRSGGHFYLGNTPPTKEIYNGAVLALTGILKNVMSSAAEAEVGALFTNTKEGTILRTTLEEMGHPQPATPVTTDNSTACGIANDTIKQQRSRAIDMRFYWVRDRVQQGQFIIYWAPGSINLADYYTKHHSPAHHRKMRATYLHTPNAANIVVKLSTGQSALRGCVDSHVTHLDAHATHTGILRQDTHAQPLRARVESATATSPKEGKLNHT